MGTGGGATGLANICAHVFFAGSAGAAGFTGSAGACFATGSDPVAQSPVAAVSVAVESPQAFESAVAVDVVPAGARDDGAVL
jgi:hypothetical protein